jgi:hypothetical protein
MIIATTLMFALLGLGVAYISVENLPIEAYRGEKVPDSVILPSVLPPLIGLVLGFVVGPTRSSASAKPSSNSPASHLGDSPDDSSAAGR